MYRVFKPQKIYIEEKARDFPAGREILSRLPDVPVETVKDKRSLIESFRSRPDAIGEGKRSLFLAYDQGRSFKPFPESEQYLSCDYYTLHLEEGCDLECSYCILQAYLTNPLTTVYVNIEEMLQNLEQILRNNPDKFFRIGTGQLADSLSLDHLTHYSRLLVPFFARQSNAVLELKTKSDQIQNLLDLKPGGRTIVSWSMNSKRIQEAEEHKCASISERLAAARQITHTDSFRAAFHFDPIIDYEGWEKDYEEVIHELFDQIPHERIAWISLGCLRMMRELKPIMQERFPKSSLASAEWIQGMDGKLRYFKPRRVEIYQKMAGMIRRHNPDATIYLSMETPEVWRRVLGFEATKETVCQMLDVAGQTKALV